MELERHLLTIENELAGSAGDAYRRHLADDALVIVPGHVLDRSSTIDAMEASPGWDEYSIDGSRLLEVDEQAAVISYTFKGRRGDDRYAAILTSLYAKRGEDWRLVLHQQTPLGSDDEAT